MNAPTFRALALDSLYQVFDNRVFRILAILVLIPILATFLIGFHEDSISILFGWREYPYDDVLGVLGPRSASIFKDDSFRPFLQEMAISTASELLVSAMAGSVGMMLAIAATAFFVPRMLEKGAADTLFHKPSDRWLFYLARYFSGLLFVALLGIVLVTGMYLGFLSVSRYSAPGVFWGAATLIYTFGLVHAFSMAVGVFTRSTVAAILLSLLFFMGTGCVHGLWVTKEFNDQGGVLASRSSEATAEGEGEQATPVEEVADAEAAPSERNKFWQGLLVVLDVLHYGLPKTSDADYIARLIQRRVERDGLAFLDRDTGLTMTALPPNFESVPPTDPSLRAAEPALDADLGEARFALRSSQGADACQLVLRTRPQRELTSTRRDGTERTFPESRIRASRALEDLVEDQPLQRDVERTSTELIPLRAFAIPTAASKLSWSDHTTEETRRRIVLQLQEGEVVHAIDVNASPEFLESEAGVAFLEWLDHGVFVDGKLTGTASGAADPGSWYSGVFGPHSIWKYNVFFSIGSSVLFTLLILGLGIWKLSRIDF